MREKITVSPQAIYPVMHAFQVKFEKKIFAGKTRMRAEFLIYLNNGIENTEKL